MKMTKLRVIVYCSLALSTTTLILKPLINTTASNPYNDLSTFFTTEATTNQAVFYLPQNSQNNKATTSSSGISSEGEKKSQVGTSFSSHPPISLDNNNNNNNNSQKKKKKKKNLVDDDPINNNNKRKRRDDDDKDSDPSSLSFKRKKDVVVPLSSLSSSKMEYYFVAVASMQRSSSTSFVFRVLNRTSPCFVPMDEIYNKGPKDKPELWKEILLNTPSSLDYNPKLGHSRGIQNYDLLVTFAQRHAERACQWRKNALYKHNNGLDMNLICHNKCIVAFKQFPEHLFNDQHLYIWNHLPNVTVTILERNVVDRWKSIWLAAKDGDWDTTGSVEHKAKLTNEQIEIPSVTESSKICKTSLFQNIPGFTTKSICQFNLTHTNWYTFARNHNPNRIDVTFEESIMNHGSEAIRKVKLALKEKYGLDDTAITWN